MALEGTYTHDNLVQMGKAIDSKYVTILSGQDLSRGDIVGKVTLGAATAVADESNTGDGVMGAITVGAKAKVGAYILTIVSEAANAGGFKVVDPDGVQLDSGTVGVAYSNDHLAFTLADGAEDFDIGDFFTITVAAGSGKFKLCDKTATDGSADPYGIVVQDVDASLADKTNVAIYTAGEFSEDAVGLADGTVVADVYDALRDKGIYLSPVTQEG